MRNRLDQVERYLNVKEAMKQENWTLLHATYSFYYTSLLFNCDGRTDEVPCSCSNITSPSNFTAHNLCYIRHLARSWSLQGINKTTRKKL